MRYPILGILAFWYLSFVQFSFGLTQRQQPLNELGVTLDYSLANWEPPENWSARVPRNWFFSSHITFNGPVSQITDGQLWNLAFKAYSYLDADMSQYKIDAGFKPGAMTILAWGNEIILASSQKGSNSFTYQGKRSKVSIILEECQVTYLQKWKQGTAKEHRTQGKCGEEMSTHLYYLLQPEKNGVDLDAQNGVIGTVGRDPQSGKVVTKNPCGPGSIVSQHVVRVPLSTADANSNRRENGDAIFL